MAQYTLRRQPYIKLADFARSSLDGYELHIVVTSSHEYPGSLLSVRGDLFAFGSTLYQLLSGSRPYNGLSDEKICAHYSKGIFPETESLGVFGRIITKCWHGQYSRCKFVIGDLKDMYFQIIS